MANNTATQPSYCQLPTATSMIVEVGASGDESDAPVLRPKMTSWEEKMDLLVEGYYEMQEMKRDIKHVRAMEKPVSRIEKIELITHCMDEKLNKAEINHLSLKCQVNRISRNQQTSDIMGIVLSIILGIILTINIEPPSHVQYKTLIITSAIFGSIFFAVFVIDLKWPAKVYESVVWRTVRASHMHVQVVVATFAGFWTNDRNFGILLLGVALCETFLQLLSHCIIRISTFSAKIARCECCRRKCCFWLKVETEIEAVFASVAQDDALQLFANFLRIAAGMAFLTELSEPTVEQLTQRLEEARLQYISKRTDKDYLNQADWKAVKGNEDWTYTKTIKVLNLVFKFIKTGKKEQNS